ncbi:MAG TPA: DEAD/DEAH box helicase [Jatrophihabitans sp.]|jgi:ATP-dependent RNA helicase HelY
MSVEGALDDFQRGYEFALDDFQLEACRDLDDGYGVLVCAPTGSGKTVVGEFAVFLALALGQKCFYTTPIKALSNQKYNDLVERHGVENVGLLTGDTVVNGEAPIVVMTTEVLRNMLYVASDTLAGLGYVVMDEVHFLGDRFRGAVWEEVIIHLPASVRLVSLSATVSNAEEFGEWLVSVRGETRVIVHEERPVPLWQHLMVGSRIFDLFAQNRDGRHVGDQAHSKLSVDPGLIRYLDDRQRHGSGESMAGRSRPARGGRRPAGWKPPYRPDVITRLDNEGLLPAITFIFSRAGCDAAVQQCVRAGLWLTDEDEREEIEQIIGARVATIPDEDLDVLGYWDWRDGLRRGVAAHHAGMVPVFKQTVEELFTRGLVRAVFATETLALGINMPARTVVIERLTKFNGQAHVDLTAGEYTQLTGRAGRRGIDVEGHAVVLWSPEVEPGRVAGLASTRTYPLRSSFRPSYNMAVNLVGQMGTSAARDLLESSFAQFQADRGSHGVSAQIRKHEAQAAEFAEKMHCHLGDFTEYARLRRELSDREAEISRSGKQMNRLAVVASLEALKQGDVIRVPAGRRAGFAVVLDPGLHPRNDPSPLVVTEARWGGRLSLLDFPSPVEVMAQLRLRKQDSWRSPADRKDIASRIRALDLPSHAPRGKRRVTDAADDPTIQRLRDELRAHPCHQCPDREQHARWGERYFKVRKEIESLERRLEGRTGSLGRTFDRICELLRRRGYLHFGVDGTESTTDVGKLLSRIWSEADLVVAECLRNGAWDGLAPAELAAVISSMVYEPRREERAVESFPSEAVAAALTSTLRTWGEVVDAEEGLGLPLSKEPQAGFVWPIYRWVRGERLERALSAPASSHGGPEVELSAGDFIRWCKQVVDLLEQLAGAPNSPVARTAQQAASAIRRGVVAQSMSV